MSLECPTSVNLSRPLSRLSYDDSGAPEPPGFLLGRRLGYELAVWADGDKIVDDGGAWNKVGERDLINTCRLRVRFAGRRVPDLGRVIESSELSCFGENPAPVPANGEVYNPGPMPFEDDGRAGPHIPDLEDSVIASCRELAAIGPKCHGLHKGLVAVHGRRGSAGRTIPEPDASVLARRGKPCTVRAEREPRDESFVTVEDPFKIPSLEVPETDGPVPPARGEPLAVRAERDAEDPSGMPT